MAETFINGSFNGSNAQYLTFKCGWEVLSQDKANKTSTVQLRWIVTKTISNLGTFKSNAPWSQTVDGTTTSGSLNFNLGNVAANTDYVIRTDVVTIAHNANGTKTAAISGSLDLSGTSAGIGSFSGSMALPTIATDPPTGLSIAVSDMWTHPTGIASTTYVGGYSKFKLTASATPVSPATIANYAFYANDALLQSGTSTSYTYPQPLAAGTYEFKLVVTDSYGNSSTTTRSVTVLPYRMPSVYAEAYRCAGATDNTPDPSGVYVRLRIQASYSNNISGNALVTRQTELGGNTYTWSYDSASRIEGTFPTANSYNAIFTVTDVIGNSATAKVFIPTEFVNFDLYPDSEVGGAAFGMIAKQDLFSVNHPAEFLDDAAVSGALIVEGSANFNNGVSSAKGYSLKGLARPTTLADLNTTLLAEFNDMAISSVRYVTMNPSASFAPFNGGVTSFVIYSAAAGYGTITATTYSVGAGGAVFTASIYNNTISDWMSLSPTPTVFTSGIVNSVSGMTLKAQGGVKFGRVASITISVYGSLGSNAATSGTIASGWLPPTDMRASGASAYGNSTVIATVESNGLLAIKNNGDAISPTNNSPLKLNLTYIIGN